MQLARKPMFSITKDKIRPLYTVQQPKTQLSSSFIAISDGTLEVRLCARGVEGDFGVTIVARDPKECDEGELILSEYSSKANKDQQFNHEKKNG